MNLFFPVSEIYMQQNPNKSQVILNANFLLGKKKYVLSLELNN